MTLEAFLTWDAPPDARWQLVDGVPLAMAPASPVHAAIQNELGALLRNHLADQGGACRAYANPGVKLGEKTDINFRIPDLGVSCTPLEPGDPALPDPVLLIEILSPSNPRETWMNVWAYTSIPSVQEVLVVRSDIMGAQLLRRQPDGTWPVVPDTVADTADLRSVGQRLPLNALYAGTWLAANAT
jgi:Uma2 family endonuclease